MHPAPHHPGMSPGGRSPPFPSCLPTGAGEGCRNTTLLGLSSQAPIPSPDCLQHFHSFFGEPGRAPLFFWFPGCAPHITQGGWERSHSPVFWQKTQLPDLLGMERMVDPRNQPQSKIWGMHPPLTHLLQRGCSGWKRENEEVYPGPGGECLLS